MLETHEPRLETKKITSQGGWEAYAKLSSLTEVGLWPFMWQVAVEKKSQRIPVVLSARIGTTRMSPEDEGLFIEQFAGTDQLFFEDIAGTDNHSFLDISLIYNFLEGKLVGETIYPDAADAMTVRALPKGNILVFHATHSLDGKTINYEKSIFKSGNLQTHTEGPANQEIRRLFDIYPPLAPVAPFVRTPSKKFPHLTVLE